MLTVIAFVALCVVFLTMKWFSIQFCKNHNMLGTFFMCLLAMLPDFSEYALAILFESTIGKDKYNMWTIL